MDIDTGLLKSAVEKTNSEIVLFAVVILIALVAFLLPLYRMIAADRTKLKEHETALIKEVLGVVSANSDVISKLNSVVSKNNSATSKTLVRIHDRIDHLREAFDAMRGRP